jgi:hypothetical protein
LFYQTQGKLLRASPSTGSTSSPQASSGQGQKK